MRCFNDGSGPNKHTTDKAANRLQLPLQQLIELAADVRRRMLEGASLSSALETVSIGLSAQARAALQSIVYDAIRRRAFSNAAAAGLLSSPPPPPVMGLLEIAIALVVEGRYSDFTSSMKPSMQHATTAEPYALQGSSMPCCAVFTRTSKFQQFYKRLGCSLQRTALVDTPN